MIRKSATTLVLMSCVVLQGCGQTIRRESVSPAPSAPRSTATVRPVDDPTEIPNPANSDADIPAYKQNLQSSELAMDQQAVGYFMDVQQARLTQVGGDQLTLQRDGNRRITLSLPGTLTFEVGSASLSERGQRSLLQVAAILAEFKSSLIVIHGHTDDTGTPQGNRLLSQQRAQSVARLLKQSGVNEQRMLVIGHGSDKPLLPNTDQASRERNRRVELVIEPLVRGAAKQG